MVDEVLAGYTLSHDMIRIEVDDPLIRAYIATFLQTPTGQALLRRNMSGSVIDHLTVTDVKGVPVPFLSQDAVASIGGVALDAITRTERARLELLQLADAMAQALPMPSSEGLGRHGWSLRSGAVRGRLDAAFHDPLVAEVREQIGSAGGGQVRDVARAIKPPRYRRFYVDEGHGTPVLSGRQLLQARPINLRYVSDRSFKDRSEYELASGMTVFGGVGRAEGRLGSPVMITSTRSGWLASEDVVRLQPHDGTAPGALWLSVASPQVQLQLRALTFGSVVDHLAAEDVDAVLLPPVPGELAARAETAWWEFDAVSVLTEAAIAQFEAALAA